ncbi:helix-turn-helix domain-containing protein [Xanthomonas maliensis]|uniref:helix-turn-helix domain-containing protein n=1 Tax=Xanthomonas maliensis TaxID=1321368 RepID=UPI00056E3DBA|nr:helix-turn-helix domain-containing protein [Xanthomonas maliensis]KAB7767602.1 helix-turn-helix domain-containing protein [Xanthomonas maliensis]
MNESNPTQAVLQLVRAGWSESRIAKEVGTSQPTIHRVKHGQKSVAFDIGVALIRLAESHGGPAVGTQEVA